MPVNDIYELVNSVSSQALGTTALTVVDDSTLVALGNTVLSSSTNTENFLNTLVARIGKTIFSYRRYDNHYSDYMLSDFQYGAILQKIKVKLPVAEEDGTVLTDNESVDMYKVTKPEVSQKLFQIETTYDFKITIQRKWLKQAFLSGSALDGFVQLLYGEVENAINLAFETLTMACINNYIAECDGTARTINLVTEYNEKAGTSLTSESCLLSKDFIAYAMKRIKMISKFMTRMSTLYNDGTEQRHTPFNMQRMLVLTDFEQSAETVLQYQAFNKNYVELEGYMEVPFWQSAQTPGSINVKRASDSTAKTVENIICVLHDRDALGIYREDEETATTPLNAKGMYYNTFWHFHPLYFNDLSENLVVFTLN